MSEIFMAGPDITSEDEEYVLDALRNGWYGSKAYYYVEKFESEFAKFHERKYALMTTNCTSAIHLCLLSLNISEEDEVIVPDCTWIGSASPIKYVGGKTIFADIDEENWCLSSDSIEAALSKKTKAIIAVNLYGNMPEYDEIESLCKKNSIYLIEDAAESLGSTYKNRRSGNFGDFSVFSFHRSKTLTTGEGGMLLTDDKNLYNRCKFLRDHGRQPGSYFNTEIAYKFMPFNLQAALGYSQFKRLDKLVERKKRILDIYKEEMSDISDLFFNTEPSYIYNSAWSTTLVLGKSHNLEKEQIINNLTNQNLPARPFFYPLSSLPAYNQIEKYEQVNLISYSISKKGINLPCALNITDEQIKSYCSALKSIILN